MPDKIEKYYNPSTDKRDDHKVNKMQKDFSKSIGRQIVIAVSVALILALLGYHMYKLTGV